jgi:hypothetical protein
LDFFRGLLFEYGIRPVTIGIDLYAANDYEAAMLAEEEIRKADCVVAVLSKRYRTAKGDYRPSEWNYEEQAIGLAANRPLYVFYEDGIFMKGASVASARFGVQFSRDRLKDDRQRLSNDIRHIREDLSSMKTQQFWGTVGVIAVIGGGIYLLSCLLDWTMKTNRGASSFIE